MKPQNVTINSVRLANLSVLVKQFGSELKLAQKIGHKNGSTLNQLKSGARNFGERLARDIEEKLDLPAGWMDAAEHATTTPQAIDATLLARVMETVTAAATHAGVKLSDNKLAELVALVYTDSTKGLAFDAVRITHLLKLMR